MFYGTAPILHQQRRPVLPHTVKPTTSSDLEAPPAALVLPTVLHKQKDFVPFIRK